MCSTGAVSSPLEKPPHFLKSNQQIKIINMENLRQEYEKETQGVAINCNSNDGNLAYVIWLENKVTSLQEELESSEDHLANLQKSIG